MPLRSYQVVVDYGAIGKDGLSGSTPDFPQTSSFTIKNLSILCYKKQNLLYPADKLGRLTKHHLRPRSLKGECTESNISYVPEKLHQAWHLLFSNLPPERIVQIINEHYLDPEYTMMAIPIEDLEKVQQALIKGSKY